MPKKRNTKLPKITQLPSGAYHAKVYSHTDDQGKRHYESFTRYDYNQLVLELAQYKSDKKRARIEKDRNDPTLGEAIDNYLTLLKSELSASTYKAYASIRRNHFLNLQRVRMSQITPVDIQKEISSISKNHSPKTVRNIHGFIAAVFGKFYPDFQFATTFPKPEKSIIEIPTEEDIKRLLSITESTPMYLPILLGSCCGMRRSEICSLTWDKVDFARNTITVDGALVYNENNELVAKKTKTYSSTRVIRMFPIVAEALREHKDRGQTKVVTLTPNSITKRFERLIIKHGFPHFTFHGLRHYTVSVMLSLNIPKNYIADYVGHENESMAMIDKVYGHIMASKKTSVEDQMQDYFAKIMG